MSCSDAQLCTSMCKWPTTCMWHHDIQGCKCGDMGGAATVLTLITGHHLWIVHIALCMGGLCGCRGTFLNPSSAAGQLAVKHFADILVAAASVAAEGFAAECSGQCCLHSSLPTCPSHQSAALQAVLHFQPRQVVHQMLMMVLNIQ